MGLPGRGFATGDGEEYTPPDYRPAVLPGPLAAVRVALFGPDPDRRALACRTRQFLALLHAGPMADEVAAADPRVTYLPLVAGGRFELVPAVVTAAHDGHAFTLEVGGEPPPGTVAGRAELSWTVAVEAGSVLRIADDAGGWSTTSPLDFAGGLSRPVAVPGTALTLRVRDDVPAGTAWTLTALARPDADLGALVARLESAGDGLRALFGTTPTGPYRSWRNRWESNRPLPERLGAVLLALAARADEARTRP